MTIEQMQNNYEYNVKRREAVEVVYRAQVGLHASNGVERTRLQERINNGLLFDGIEYRSGEETSGFFDVEINGIVPMPSDDITRSEERRVGQEWRSRWVNKYSSEDKRRMSDTGYRSQ